MLNCAVDERFLLLSPIASRGTKEDGREWVAVEDGVAEPDGVAEHDGMADCDEITGTAAIVNPDELPSHMAKGNGVVGIGEELYTSRLIINKPQLVNVTLLS